ncbi:unnamed protein product [Chrysoparadoxa australica]
MNGERVLVGQQGAQLPALSVRRVRKGFQEQFVKWRRGQERDSSQTCISSYLRYLQVPQGLGSWGDGNSEPGKITRPHLGDIAPIKHRDDKGDDEMLSWDTMVPVAPMFEGGMYSSNHRSAGPSEEWAKIFDDDNERGSASGASGASGAGTVVLGQTQAPFGDSTGNYTGHGQIPSVLGMVASLGMTMVADKRSTPGMGNDPGSSILVDLGIGHSQTQQILRDAQEQERSSKLLHTNAHPLARSAKDDDSFAATAEGQNAFALSPSQQQRVRAQTSSGGQANATAIAGTAAKRAAKIGRERADIERLNEVEKRLEALRTSGNGRKMLLRSIGEVREMKQKKRRMMMRPGSSVGCNSNSLSSLSSLDGSASIASGADAMSEPHMRFRCRDKRIEEAQARKANHDELKRQRCIYVCNRSELVKEARLAREAWRRKVNFLLLVTSLGRSVVILQSKYQVQKVHATRLQAARLIQRAWRDIISKVAWKSITRQGKKVKSIMLKATEIAKVAKSRVKCQLAVMMIRTFLIDSEKSYKTKRSIGTFKLRCATIQRFWKGYQGITQARLLLLAMRWGKVENILDQNRVATVMAEHASMEKREDVSRLEDLLSEFNDMQQASLRLLDLKSSDNREREGWSNNRRSSERSGIGTFPGMGSASSSAAASRWGRGTNLTSAPSPATRAGAPGAARAAHIARSRARANRFVKRGGRYPVIPTWLRDSILRHLLHTARNEYKRHHWNWIGKVKSQADQTLLTTTDVKEAYAINSVEGSSAYITKKMFPGATMAKHYTPEMMAIKAGKEFCLSNSISDLILEHSLCFAEELLNEADGSVLQRKRPFDPGTVFCFCFVFVPFPHSTISLAKYVTYMLWSNHHALSYSL